MIFLAKVLYTVCGIGMGHAMRSTPIIESLSKKHEILAASYGNAYDYLQKKFPIESFEWFKLVFTGGRFRKTHTMLQNIPALPYIAAKNLLTAIKIFREFKPDIVVSDFDANGIYLAELFGIPSITISNMHLMNFEKIPLDLNEKIEYYLTEKPVLDSFNSTDYLLVTSLIQPKACAKNTFFFKPLIRETVLAGKTRDNGKIVVYSTPAELKSIIPVLSKNFKNQEFIVFGAGKKQKKANIDFRQFGDKGFIEELKNCRAIMCHGGISLISEAAFLKKPIFIFTCKRFFERYYNGAIIQRLGYGTVQEQATKQNVSLFLKSVEKFKKNLDDADTRDGNKELTKKILEIIEKEGGLKTLIQGSST